MKDLFVEGLQIRAEFSAQLVKTPELVKSFWRASDILLKAIGAGNKVIIFGNGGSAAEAQHFAAELICQFEKKRAKRIGLFSIKTKKLVNSVDVAIIVPASNTALIQEAHLAIIHMLCGQIEKSL